MLSRVRMAFPGLVPEALRPSNELEQRTHDFDQRFAHNVGAKVWGGHVGVTQLLFLSQRNREPN
jgi:hypothetical protein